MTLTYPTPFEDFRDGLIRFLQPVLALFSSADDEYADREGDDHIEDDSDPDEGKITIDPDSDDYVPDEDPDDEKERRKIHDAARKSRQDADRKLFGGKDEDPDDETDGDDPDPDDDEEEDPDKDKKSKKKKDDEEPAKKPKPKNPAKTADGDIDYEADDVEEEDEEEETEDVEDEEEEDEEEEPAKGPVAEAKRNGKLLKKTTAKLTDVTLENTNLKQQLQEANERLTEYGKVKINPREHPDYVELNAKVWADVDGAIAEDLPPSCVKFDTDFSKYVETYINATKKAGAERTAAINALKQEMVETHGGLSEKYADLDDDEKQIADNLAKDLLGVVKRNSPRIEELIRIEGKIKTDAEAGRIALNAKEYAQNKAEFREYVKGVGKLDSKLVKENPFSPEAAITQLVQSSPAMAKRLEAATEDLETLMVGLRPLTAAEYESLEEQGTDIKAYLKERKKRFEEKRRSLMPLLLRGLMTSNLTKKALESLVREQMKESDTEDELKALSDIERKKKLKKTESKPEEPKYKNPRNAPSSIDQYL